LRLRRSNKRLARIPKFELENRSFSVMRAYVCIAFVFFFD